MFIVLVPMCNKFAENAFSCIHPKPLAAFPNKHFVDMVINSDPAELIW